MKHIYKFLLAIFIIILPVAGIYIFENTFKPDGVVQIQVSDGKIYTIDVEVADTPEEQSEGLMFRESLSEFKGMLFPYESERVVTFWMKNTLIPLDMIFINSNNEIVEIKHEVLPCEEDPCERYTSFDPVQYVLEVKGGLTEKYLIEEGNRVIIEK